MKTLNAKDFKGMLVSGAANLENNENEINALNVFPVPDGDTGTNMSMTFSNGTKEADGVVSENVGDIAKSLSKGLLMGARGNSGVILSQIFRGFSKSTAGKEELSGKDISDGFMEGARVAYKAIMKPVEGTILTVIREAAWYAEHDFEANPKIDAETYLKNLLEYAKESLIHTPELLPALKEAGVVDSGGAGFVKILEGFIAYIDGNPITKKSGATVALTDDGVEKEEKGYKVEFTLRLNSEYIKKFDQSIIKNRLNEAGDNLTIVNKDELLDVTISTLKPGDVLNVAQRYGEFVSLKIENPSLAKEFAKKSKPQKNFGIITVAAGEGLTNLFYELGVDVVISGGQTMNPSTQDFLQKIDELDNCKTIFIFPNNSNIILAAQQARDLSKADVVVIGSKSLQAGLSAIMLFNPDGNKEDLETELNDVVNGVKVAQITYAVKDTSFDGVEVKEGDYISLVDKTILHASTDLKETLIKTCDRLMENKDKELMTIITGEGSNEELTNEIVEYIESNSSIEVQLFEGNQPVYSYLFGLE